MKKPYYLLLLFILCITCLKPVQAQQATYIGTVSDILSDFREKATANEKRARQAGQQVHFQLQEQPPLVLTVLNAKAEGGAETFYGDVNQEKNSSFYLKISANEVSGAVVLRESKKYFEFSSGAGGQVYLTEQDINKKLCVNYNEIQQQFGVNARTGGAKAVTVPLLESLPGADAVVLLDFDGQVVSGTLWNSQFNNGNTIVAEPATLTVTEMMEVWKMISEDFRPFALNITTSEAVFNRAAVSRRVRAVFTPTNYFFTGAGGVAYLGSFAWGSTSNGETPCWIFNPGGKYAGEAGSHEIGHTLHLRHDGRNLPAEDYYYGHNDWSPIMGVGYYRNMVQWSKGEYPNANQTEDDLQMIATMNGFGYRADDHSNSNAGATPLVVTASGSIQPSSNKGIISTREDTDVFSFNLASGTVTLSVDPEPMFANLDVGLTLKNSANTVVAQADPASLGASITGTFPAGTYYLVVDGVTGGLGANSDYASLGNYFISGSIFLNKPPVVSLTEPLAGASFIAPATITLAATASDPDGTVSKVEFYKGVTKIGEDQTAPYTFTWSNVPAGTYKLSAKAIDNLGEAVFSESVDVVVAPAANQYTLDITIKGSGTVKKSPSQANYGSGSVVSLTATPMAGYRFSGWSGDASGTTNPLSVTMSSNKSITATFSPVLEVSSFNLINASTEQVLHQLNSGAVLNLANLPSQKLNIQAVTSPVAVGSVVMKLSGVQSKNFTDSYFPYAVFGDDKNGNYYSWAPTVGNYTLTATAYSGSNGGGTAGATKTISFSVINSASAGPFYLVVSTVGNGTISRNPDQISYNSGSVVSLTAAPLAGYRFSGWSGDASGTTNPLSVTMNSNKSITATFAPVLEVSSFNLINASTEQVLHQLNSGAVLNLANLPSQKLNIQAVTSPVAVGSVVMKLSGAQSKTFTDSYFPYAVFGDDKNGNYYSWTPALGNYTLTATPHELSGANGTVGTSKTISFSVVNEQASSEISKKATENEIKHQLAEAYPNPFRKELHLRINGETQEPAFITLSDATGRVLMQRQVEMKDKTKDLTLEETSSLAAGIYFLRVQQGNKQQVLRVTRE